MKAWASTDFQRAEFACKCGCGFDTVDYGLVCVLEDIRAFFQQPVVISSGCRCESHNRVVGGKPSSQHLQGRAADITVKNIAPAVVYEYLNRPEVGGLGKYETFTHVDTRHGHARW